MPDNYSYAKQIHAWPFVALYNGQGRERRRPSLASHSWALGGPLRGWIARPQRRHTAWTGAVSGQSVRQGTPGPSSSRVLVRSTVEHSTGAETAPYL